MKNINEEDLLIRKSNGIFYTPEFIVKYIISNTICVYITRLYDELDLSKNLKELKLVLNKARNLKFLDPACGNGIFLLEMLKIMRDFYNFYNNRVDLLIKQKLLNQGDQDLKKIKFPGLFALINNIFGVDKDKTAIKEACSRLAWEIKDEIKINNEYLLNINIKIGNSLISQFDHKFIQKNKTQLNKLIKWRIKLQDIEESIGNHISIKKEIRKIQGPLEKDYNQNLSKYFDLEENKYKTFNWELEFPEVVLFNGGFDVIVGNPPYIRVHKQDNQLKNYLRDNYMSPKMDFDVYVCFFELSIRLLKNKGLLSFIVPDKFLVREYAENLRYLLLNNTEIIELLDISRCNVFKSSTYPIIITLKKVNEPIIISKKLVNYQDNIVNVYQIHEEIKNNVSNIKNSPNIIHKQINQLKFTKTNNCRMHINIDQIYDIIENKLEKLPKIRDFIERQDIFCGTPRAKHYHSWVNYINDEIPVTKKFLKYLVCRNLSPFSIKWGIPINSFKKTFKTPYFKFQSGAMSIQKWDRFQHVPKILIRGNDTRLTAVIDEEGHVFVGIYALIQNKYDPNYLVGLINSDLLNAYFFHMNPSIKIRGGFFSINSSHILQLPIYPASIKGQTQIMKIVSEIIDLKKQKFKSTEKNLASLGNQLNNLLSQLNNNVYELYELKKAEIAKIESFIKNYRN